MNYDLHMIIQENFAVVLMVLFLQIFLVLNNGFEPRIRRLFIEANILIMSLVIIDAWELVEATKSEPTLTRIILSILGYVIRPVIAFLINMAVWNTESKAKRWLFATPLFINTLAMMTALFSPIAFYFTEQNVFMRGPLNFVPYATAIFYLITVVIFSIRLKNEGRMGEAHVVVLIVVISMACAFMEAIWRFHSFLTASCAVGISFYYLYFHVAINETDKLTGAWNRRRFFLDAERREDRLVAVISIDLNDLKVWNDSYGHQEGDRALRAIADVCKKNKRKSWHFYRIGGDEFELLCFKGTEEEVQKFITKVQEELAGTRYSAAIGYSMKDKNKDFTKTCIEADARMYENKNYLKSRKKDKEDI